MSQMRLEYHQTRGSLFCILFQLLLGVLGRCKIRKGVGTGVSSERSESDAGAYMSGERGAEHGYGHGTHV